MKTVYSSITSCIHAFANQESEQGRASSVFFYGNKIYSYGYHYLLAEFIENPQGTKAVVINNKGYSSSTAKHISKVYSATRQYRQFDLTNIDKQLVLNQLENIAYKLIRARKPALYIQEAQRLLNSYKSYRIFMEQPLDMDILPYFETYFNEQSEKTLSDYIEQLKQEDRKKEEKRKQKNIEDTIKFMNYELNYVSRIDTDIIRLSKDQTMVETSQGVKVSVREAKILYQAIKQGKNIIGQTIDNYTVLANNGVLKIGCHIIDKKYVTLIGEQIINL